MEINSDEPRGMLLQSVELSFEENKYIKTILRLSKLNVYNEVRNMHYECKLELDCDAYADPMLTIDNNYINLKNPIIPNLSQYYGLEVNNIETNFDHTIFNMQHNLIFTMNFTNNESIDIQMSNAHNGYYPTMAMIYECDDNSQMLICRHIL